MDDLLRFINDGMNWNGKTESNSEAKETQNAAPSVQAKENPSTSNLITSEASTQTPTESPNQPKTEQVPLFEANPFIPMTEEERETVFQTIFRNHLLSKTNPVEKYRKDTAEADNLWMKLDIENPKLTTEEIEAKRARAISYLAQLEIAAATIRNHYSRISKRIREFDAKQGRNIWDKERRGEILINGSIYNEYRLTDPSKAFEEKQKKEAKKHKERLGKLELYVKGALELGMQTDAEIVEETMETFGGKYSIEQIEGAVRRAKASL